MNKLVLPEDPELEAWLLGTCIRKPDVLAECIDLVREEYFRTEGYGYIWNRMKALFTAGRDVTVATLSAEFTKPDHKEAVIALSDCVSFNKISDIRASYVDKLADMWRKRELIFKLSSIVDALQETGASKSDEVIQELEAFFGSLECINAADGPTLSGWQESLADIEAAMKQGRPAGLSTGYKALDDILGGLANSNMIVLGGRPGMGKTSLAVSIAEAAAQSGHNVYFASLEMSRRQINAKRQSMLSGISSQAIYTGQVTEDEYRRLVGLQDNKRFYVDDQGAITPDTMLARARRLQKSRGLGLIVTDYMQLMKASGGYEGDNQVARITMISNKMKAIAKELNVPLLVLSQLSRAVEARENKRPMLSDLRESGAIEQDADQVMFVYRDEYYLEREAPVQMDKEKPDTFNRRMADYEYRLQNSRGKADVIVAKNRHGRIGTVTMNFDNNTTAFRE